MQHEVKSQDDMNKIEQHSTDVLMSALEKCEKLEKQLSEANRVLLLCKKAYWFPEATMSILCDYLEKWNIEEPKNE